MSRAPKPPREPTYADERAVERIVDAAGDMARVIAATVPLGDARKQALDAVQQAVAAAVGGIRG